MYSRARQYYDINSCELDNTRKKKFSCFSKLQFYKVKTDFTIILFKLTLIVQTFLVFLFVHVY